VYADDCKPALAVVCAAEAGPPPDGWKPEEEKWNRIK
jgi:hypothetical protein